jgi:phosphomannomutase/phosphoglucomutase
MKVRGALLAGEMSGHLFFGPPWYGFDDALYAAARLVRLLAATPEPLSTLRASLPRYHATPETRIPCADERKFGVVAAVLARFRDRYPVLAVDGARVQFPEGWGLVRASNTEPALVLRAEGRTPAARDAIRDALLRALRESGAPV